MSPASIRRLTRAFRHLCAACGARRARYQYRGVVRADRDHTLCFRCFRTERDRQRASLLWREMGRNAPQETWRAGGRMTNERRVRQR